MKAFMIDLMVLSNFVYAKWVSTRPTYREQVKQKPMKINFSWGDHVQLFDNWEHVSET